MTPWTADALLRARGADRIEHPGGTLLAHLHRVRELLESWDAPSEVQLAGLCHAAYGTDGFATALFSLDERAVLVDAIGAPAEALVYLYGSCDRDQVYPQLAASTVTFADRFTGTTHTPGPHAVAAFTEITAANELDVLRHNVDFAARHGPALADLFERAAAHLSAGARRAWASRQSSSK